MMNDVAFEELAYAVFQQAVKDYRENPEKFSDAEKYIKKYIDATCPNIDADEIMRRLKERS